MCVLADSIDAEESFKACRFFMWLTSYALREVNREEVPSP